MYSAYEPRTSDELPISVLKLIEEEIPTEGRPGHSITLAESGMPEVNIRTRRRWHTFELEPEDLFRNAPDLAEDLVQSVRAQQQSDS